MDYRPSAKELSHFPFLKKAQEYIKNTFPPLDLLLEQERGRAILDLAGKRINQALSQKRTYVAHFRHADADEIASYVLSRIMVSCIRDKQLLDRMARYEAERAYYFLVTEIGAESGERGWNEDTVLNADGHSRMAAYLASEFRINITEERMPLADYVETAAALHDDRFRLVNRIVDKGFVQIRREEQYELLRERIRVFLRRDLPYTVPSSLCERLQPVTDSVKKVQQERMLQQFGAIDESAFPPCMQALLLALTSGANLTHAGRFALTAFVHAIGMDVTGIMGLYARSPDYDQDMTMYQVEHITGRGGAGTEYTAPACASMKTTGLCVRRDALCERCSHPLGYYTAKKGGPKKPPGPETV